MISSPFLLEVLERHECCHAMAEGTAVVLGVVVGRESSSGSISRS